MKPTTITPSANKFIRENSANYNLREMADKLGVTYNAVKHFVEYNRLPFKKFYMNRVEKVEGLRMDFTNCPITGHRNY